MLGTTSQAWGSLPNPLRRSNVGIIGLLVLIILVILILRLL
jgi:hypothetical protein